MATKQVKKETVVRLEDLSKMVIGDGERWFELDEQAQGIFALRETERARLIGSGQETAEEA